LKLHLKENDPVTRSANDKKRTGSVKAVTVINNGMTIRIKFFWVITLRQWVIRSRRFETNVLS